MTGSIRIGDWLVRPQLNALECASQEQPIEPRAMEVLVYLAEHPDEVVSKEQLIRDIWEGAFVTDEVLTYTIHQLRKALGDDAKHPRFIQTIPKKGYRLVAPVSWSGGEPIDDRKRPYPGLSPFSEKDAEFFYGREEEVEALWGKLCRSRLLAVIGPSGTGKSSFLAAGLIPARPEGWQAVICHPGEKPFRALAQALVPEFAGDTEATQLLFRLDELDSAVLILERWRKSHPEVLLCLDQFEELFTLTPEESQSRFAELLGRAAAEVGVHVLVSIRDDFLIHCHHHPALAPLFSDITPLTAPKGAALRRVLVEPAKKCGYRFEDESLAAEMLSEVTAERGALPLLAFAVSRLWDKRDCEERTLTRTAYLEIGGVAGALAQHADTALEHMGAERQEMVREVFRNLVTAQGTRAARDKEELLSVFEDRDAGEEVLGKLIDARLLTSFEVRGLEGEEARQRVEIIHESLLASWPRLVRWQTQDADNAQLRDQLRQAAHLWAERGRPAELLWTGAPFREFQVWREHYPGALSEVEEAFAQSMMTQAERRRRRRRFALAAAFSVLLGVSSVIGVLWQKAVEIARRAEGAKLLALGQLELEERPSSALAHAIASLELADEPEARRYAQEAHRRGPTELHLTERRLLGLDFSPDGRWLALGSRNERISIWPMAGGEPLVLSGAPSTFVVFGPNSDFLVSWTERPALCTVWSIPDGRRIRNLNLQQPGNEMWECIPIVDGRLITWTRNEDWTYWHSWSMAGDGPTFLGRLPTGEVHGEVWSMHAVDPSGTWLGSHEGRAVYISRLDHLETGLRKPVGEHDRPTWSVAIHPDSEKLASVDVSGEVRLWSRTQGSGDPLRMIQTGHENLRIVGFDRTGSRLFSRLDTSGIAAIWDLTGPPDADPLYIERRKGGWFAEADFHPEGTWVATATLDGEVLYPLTRTYPYILRGQRGTIRGLAFAPDGSWIASSSMEGELRLWPLSTTAGERSQLLLETNRLYQLAVDPGGRFLLAGTDMPKPLLVSVADGSARELSSPDPLGFPGCVAFGQHGRWAAAAGMNANGIRVWDLETGNVKALDAGHGEGVWKLEFTPEGRLLASTEESGDLRLWDVEGGSFQLLRKNAASLFDLGLDGRTLLGVYQGRARVFDLEDGSWRELPSHGSRVTHVALDPTGRLAVTGDESGVIRVGPITGEEPHLLLGHEGEVTWLEVSPKGDWIASGGADNTVRLWPIPQGQPFHTLPYGEFLRRLRALTNLRVVPDDNSPTGYRLDIAPFPGFETVPVW